MNILGLDLSTKVTGWAVINENQEIIGIGEINLQQYKKPSDRMKYLRVTYNEIELICKKYEPSIVAVENIYLKNVLTLKSLSKLRGVVELAITTCGIKSISEYTPSHIRKIVLEKGNLDKAEICSILEKRYNMQLATDGYDQSDALMVALCESIELKKEVPEHAIEKRRNSKRR